MPWSTLLTRSPLLLVPVAAVGLTGAALFLGSYRASKWTSAVVLRVSSDQQSACKWAGALGTVPLPLAFVVYRELRHSPPNVADTIQSKIGQRSVQAAAATAAAAAGPFAWSVMCDADSCAVALCVQSLSVSVGRAHHMECCAPGHALPRH
jgi:hypothetical protein